MPGYYPDYGEAALRRRLERFLHTADAARAWLAPAEPPLPLPPPLWPPPVFADYDTAVDWSESEQPGFAGLVQAASSAGLDQQAWQLAETLWQVWPPSAADADWLRIGQLGLAAAEREGDTDGRIRLLMSLGTAYRSANRLDEGLRSLAQALELCRSSDNRLDEAHALNLVGLLHLRARRLDSAAACFGSALSTFRETGADRWVAVVLSNVASTRLNAGPAAEAAEAVRLALDAYQELDDRWGEGNALRLAAALHTELGELDEAEACVREAMRIALALRDHALEAYWLITLGDVQRATVTYGDALISYQRSAALHRRLGDRSREALAWRGAGLTYEALDRPAEAAAFHRRAAAVHAELGDAWEQAVELDHLGAALHSRDPEAARGHWTQALVCLTPFTDPRADALRARIEQRPARDG
ncbi:tetratricopeptide repeat protein [Streptomyces sp. NBC_01477]|uniref:tetratricopeptide repeat protein n=1 Tax=Streptomyces sp. NBC_01477 TaxID=2976015 RepID=UPI002E3635D5|nr:tetratricopeptide repeat protein [Streptomyces sp. NBC_01477]